MPSPPPSQPRHSRRLRPTALPDWPIPFDRRFELDWSDPEVSRRVLREHLDQSHDGASRRLDVGDPVLRHARSLARDARLQGRATFRKHDLRSLDETESYDAVLLIYYVLEAFRRSQQPQVLRRLAAALRPGGVLVAELRVRPDQPPGRLSAWDYVPFSILADRRHLLLTDAAYDDEAHTYVLREIAVLDDGVAVQQTTGAFTPLADVEGLFGRAGLEVRAVYDGWSRYR